MNHDPEETPFEEGEHMKLARLELAIEFKQKKVNDNAMPSYNQCTNNKNVFKYQYGGKQVYGPPDGKHLS